MFWWQFAELFVHEMLPVLLIVVNLSFGWLDFLKLTFLQLNYLNFWINRKEANASQSYQELSADVLVITALSILLLLIS